jgi:hypothetical protein
LKISTEPARRSRSTHFIRLDLAMASAEQQVEWNAHQH